VATVGVSTAGAESAGAKRITKRQKWQLKWQSRRQKRKASRSLEGKADQDAGGVKTVGGGGGDGKSTMVNGERAILRTKKLRGKPVNKAEKTETEGAKMQVEGIGHKRKGKITAHESGPLKYAREGGGERVPVLSKQRSRKRRTASLSGKEERDFENMVAKYRLRKH
jgi:hypothetical protein